MLTEREIENKLKEKFAELFQGVADAPRIIGVWDVAQQGEVKGLGDASTCVLAVNVGIRQYASFCEPQADFICSTVISIRRDAAPTGAALADLIEPFMNLMHIWNEDCDRMCDDLTTDTFNPGGFQLTGGSLLQNEDCWTVDVNFILRGIVHVIEDNSTTTIQE